MNYTQKSIIRPAWMSGLLIGTMVWAGIGARADVQVVDLRCEYQTAPLGIDTKTPHLSWRMESGEMGQKQTAYQILVASSPSILAGDKGDLWDSGRVVSEQSQHIAYAGKPLRSKTACFWKAMVWDKDGTPSEWSPPARWTMGLLTPEDPAMLETPQRPV